MKYRQITREEFEAMSDVGYYSNLGATIGNNKEVVVDARLGLFIVPIEDFERIDLFNPGDQMGIRLKAETLLAIGGMPKTEEDEIASQLGIPVECANDLIYLRNRSRWTQELEDKLIQLYKEGKRPNIYEYGNTAATLAKTVWDLSKDPDKPR